MTLRRHLTLALCLALFFMIEVSIPVVGIVNNGINRSIAYCELLFVCNFLVDEWIEVEETA
jgi:hypothetical protein